MKKSTIYRIIIGIIGLFLGSLMFFLFTNGLITQTELRISLFAGTIILIVVVTIINWDAKRRRQPEPYEIEKY